MGVRVLPPRSAELAERSELLADTCRAREIAQLALWLAITPLEHLALCVETADSGSGRDADPSTRRVRTTGLLELYPAPVSLHVETAKPPRLPSRQPLSSRAEAGPSARPAGSLKRPKWHHRAAVTRTPHPRC